MGRKWTVRREARGHLGPSWEPVWVVRSPDGETYGVFVGTHTGWALAIGHANACAQVG